jgi:PDZ domain-containing protein
VAEGVAVAMTRGGDSMLAMDQGTREAPYDTVDELGGEPSGVDWATPAPRQKMPKWPIVLGVLLLVVGFTLNWLANLEVDYFALSPGPVNDVGDFVSVVGQDPVEDAGELFFLTVSLKEVTALEYIGGWLDPEVTLNKRETIRPAGVSQEELTRQNLALMEGSKRDAIFVALTRLGYEPQLIGSGALILGTIEGTAADGVLQAEDVIVEVDGVEVEFANDAVDALSGKTPGTEVELVIERAGENGTSETLTVEIVLGPFMGFDENEEPIVDESRGMVGVLLEDAETEELYPVDVQIDSQNIGGPSAGLMFTLELINQLTDEDITRGRRIAGTGTIDRDGVVGPIGGVQQKVFGAIRAGADHVLVPAANYEDALVAAGDDISVVRVETVDDALAFLDSL